MIESFQSSSKKGFVIIRSKHTKHSVAMGLQRGSSLNCHQDDVAKEIERRREKILGGGGLRWPLGSRTCLRTNRSFRAKRLALETNMLGIVLDDAWLRFNFRGLAFDYSALYGKC